MILGMDFGTTNSGLAVYDGSVRLLRLDPANAANPAVVRTMLYISNRRQYLYGRAAINEYYERNHGRPIRLRREYVGEISLTYAELGTFFRDVYVWVDELEPGRLFRSLKMFLPDDSYVGTSVWGKFYTLAIRLAGQNLEIIEPLSRGEFEQIISGETEAISRCVDEALVAAQMPRQKIDAVVRTGGSSLIPAFKRLLERKFGRSKVRPVDEFTSVTAGLAIAAWQLQQGRRELQSYAANTFQPPE